MITYDLFSKKKCNLKENNIVVDGEVYPIYSIEEVGDYKPWKYLIITGLIIITPLILYFAYSGFQDNIINHHGFTDIIINSVTMIFLLGTLIFLWWFITKLFFIDCPDCKSIWIVNEKGVYIEGTDDISLDHRLRQVQNTLEYQSATGSDSIWTKLKKNMGSQKRVNYWISSVLIFCSTCLLDFGGYISHEVFIFVMVALLIYGFIDEHNSLRWKK